jgi:hypothetical protein
MVHRGFGAELMSGILNAALASGGAGYNYGTVFAGHHLDAAVSSDVSGSGTWTYDGAAISAGGKFGNGLYSGNAYVAKTINSTTVGVDVWMRPASQSADYMMYGPSVTLATASHYMSVGLIFDASGSSVYWSQYFLYQTASNSSATYTIPPLTSAWHHISMGYDGTTYRLFIDGVLQYSAAAGHVNGVLAPQVAVSVTPPDGLPCIDDLIVYSNPRTTNFTPPAAPFPF